MVKPTLLIATIVFLLGISNITYGQSSKQSTANSTNKELKFLDDIAIEPAAAVSATEATPSRPIDQFLKSTFKSDVSYAAKRDFSAARSAMSVEKASSLQIKYALLLDMEVELIKNLNLFKLIDDWYGVRYRLGGMTKSGIDCSALMQIFFTALYGIALPRTAKEQFEFSRRISRTDLREGDLVFFNTRGGVSHVGMYLANDRFVHASTSGVTISSLYDDYYAKRFIGVGRIDAIAPEQGQSVLSPKP